MPRQMSWKHFYFIDTHDRLYLHSAWQSSHAAFGKDKRLFMDQPFIITNLPWRDLRALARSVGVNLPDAVITDENDEIVQELLSRYSRKE